MKSETLSMRPKCVNLKERFGDRYRVEFEESYSAERPEVRAAEAPWLMVIPCQHGHICPWGGQNLAACTSKNGSVATRLRKLPFVMVAQDGDDGINAVFPAEHFEQVVAIMKPRRRRKLSREHKQKLAEAGARFRYKKHGSKAPKSTPEDESGGLAGP